MDFAFTDEQNRLHDGVRSILDRIATPGPEREPAVRLAGESHRARSCLLAGLRLECVTTTAGDCGVAQPVVDQGVSHPRPCKPFGQMPGSFPFIAHVLGDMRTAVEASRLMRRRAASRGVRGDNARRAIFQTTPFAWEPYVDAAEQGLQVMGADGGMEEFDRRRQHRGARSTIFTAGTSLMRRSLIAGHLFGTASPGKSL